MRANPLVCVEVDEIAAHDQWVSVIAFGRFEELPEPPGGKGARLRAPERPRNVTESLPPWSAGSRRRQCDKEGCDSERERAWRILQTHPGWWEAACTAWVAHAHSDPAEPFHSVYYKIRIDRVTGREATRDTRDAISYAVQAPHTGRWNWLRLTLTRVFGSRSKEDASTS